MEKGAAATLQFTVGEGDTAAAIEPSIAASQTSIGTRVSLEHLAASPVGEQVSVGPTQRLTRALSATGQSNRRLNPSRSTPSTGDQSRSGTRRNPSRS